jgi:polysaccharide biosynthesis/export protein
VEEVLRVKYLKDPHVTVFVREYASQPVSVLGAVKMPGIYQIKGQKSLLDMLAMAQGLDQTAGNTIQIIRKNGADEDTSARIEVNALELFEKGKTELNITIQAGDVINVLHAGSIFVVGEVVRPGEFVLRQGRNVTASQAIALGSGFTREAKKAACTVIRVLDDGTKEEIAVNVAKILDGSFDDVSLMPNDILFVPSHRIKSGLKRTLDTTIAIVSGRLMYVR